jgi:hypothetical protein
VIKEFRYAVRCAGATGVVGLCMRK